MAFKINREKMEQDNGGDYTPETKHIPAGLNQARLVSYVELGKHIPIFMGKHAVYGKESKKAGEPKPPEFMIQLVFEFPRCAYDNFPLTIKTSVPFGNKGDFINKLSVSDALMSGNISMSYANRSKYMKYLNAMNDACGTSHDSLADFVGEAFLIAVTNKPGKKAREDGTLPVYANMKPDGINSTKYIDQMDQQEKVAQVPEVLGEYCSVFYWDEPTEEAWKEVPKYLKDCMKKASDFPGSPLEAMLAGMPEEESPESEEDTTPPANTGRPVEPETSQEPVPDDDIPF